MYTMPITLLSGFVIRLLLMYGTPASILAPLFRKAYEGKVLYQGAATRAIMLTTEGSSTVWLQRRLESLRV